MKAAVRKTIAALTLAAMVLGFGFVTRLSAKDRALKTCSGINVIYTDDYRFVNENDIKAWLDNGYGQYIGQRLDSIKLHKVEKVLNVQSAILNTEAYTTDDGLLNIKLSQREPVLRFQKGDYGFYADANGFIFPLQENYTTQVPVIDGNIPIQCEPGYKGAPKTEEEQTWMKGALALISSLHKNKNMENNIVQIHVDDNGDIIMVPREGNEKFIFGSPFNAEDKFRRMENYYKYIVPSKEEGYYKTVNVKFDKQIVCKK